MCIRDRYYGVVNSLDAGVNYGDVSGGYDVAGLAGIGQTLSIKNSYNFGNVTAHNAGSTFAGGLAGRCGNCTVEDSASSGNVTAAGNLSAGGFGIFSGTLLRVKTSGTITGGDGTGGVVGQLLAGTVASSIKSVESSADIRGNLGKHLLGGIVGVAESQSLSKPGLIENTHFTGSLIGDANCGGLVGLTRNYLTIKKSSSHASIDCAQTAGGLVGHVAGGNFSIQQSVSRGVVTSLLNSGGLIGAVNMTSANTVAITDSYSLAKVRSNDVAGGFVGQGGAVFTNCFAAGKLEAIDTQSRFGGFAGVQFSSGTVTGVFWDKSSSGQSSSAMGIGATTPQMLGNSLYTGFDSSIWTFSSLAYPKLLWELEP